MYERREEPIAPLSVFYLRLLRSLLRGCSLIVLALLIGMMGYHFLVGLNWLDSYLNASMILSDMGELAPLLTPAAKIFAGCYALFSGLIFVTIIAVMFAPVVHRFLHTFHAHKRL